MPIRVLLVDDVAEVRRLVRTALRFRGGFEVVGEASSGSAAVGLAGSLQPDITVLDLGLPDLAGREVLTGVREVAPATRIVVFSGTETSDQAWIAQRVEGYVFKEADLDYLVDMLERVAYQPDHEATLNLRREATSARAARVFLRRSFEAWRLHVLVDDALVVVSELTTNAVTHAHSECELRLAVRGSRVRIEVVDHGAGTPDPQRRSDTAEHGRGLHLVTGLATAWGIDVLPGLGKTVWAEMVLPDLIRSDASG